MTLMSYFKMNFTGIIKKRGDKKNRPIQIGRKRLEVGIFAFAKNVS